MAEEERYNNRQIERMLDEQSRDIKGHMDAAIAPLVIQVTKTNGRVSVMEKMVWMAAGAVVILTPFCVYLATKVTDLELKQARQPELIRTAIEETFQDYIESVTVE